MTERTDIVSHAVRLYDGSEAEGAYDSATDLHCERVDFVRLVLVSAAIDHVSYSASEMVAAHALAVKIVDFCVDDVIDGVIDEVGIPPDLLLILLRRVSECVKAMEDFELEFGPDIDFEGFARAMADRNKADRDQMIIDLDAWGFTPYEDVLRRNRSRI